jgi:histidinol-phosphate aminotransferase
MFDLEKIIRKNIKNLKPYSSARDEFSGDAKIFLDANENSFGSTIDQTYNRYPDPHQKKLKEAVSKIRNIDTRNIFLGNGSDECIDLLFRCFCEPGKDNVIICPPTYGMYEVSAAVNDVETKKNLLLKNFQLNVKEIEGNLDPNTKLIWICSPNNPTGNSISKNDIETLLKIFNGLVIIDEAYIDFSGKTSFIAQLRTYPNLVILQTFSKAWGLAALRLGVAFASEEIIRILDRAKPPYNINVLTQELCIKAIQNRDKKDAMVKKIIDERNALSQNLKSIQIVETIYHSDANFILAKIKDAGKVYEYLLTKSIVVRDRSKVQLCDDCLRITVGTKEENIQLIDALKHYTNKE